MVEDLAAGERANALTEEDWDRVVVLSSVCVGTVTPGTTTTSSPSNRSLYRVCLLVGEPHRRLLLGQELPLRLPFAVARVKPQGWHALRPPSKPVKAIAGGSQSVATSSGDVDRGLAVARR